MLTIILEVIAPIIAIFFTIIMASNAIINLYNTHYGPQASIRKWNEIRSSSPDDMKSSYDLIITEHLTELMLKTYDESYYPYNKISRLLEKFHTKESVSKIFLGLHASYILSFILTHFFSEKIINISAPLYLIGILAVIGIGIFSKISFARKKLITPYSNSFDRRYKAYLFENREFFGYKEARNRETVKETRAERELIIKRIEGDGRTLIVNTSLQNLTEPQEWSPFLCIGKIEKDTQNVKIFRYTDNSGTDDPDGSRSSRKANYRFVFERRLTRYEKNWIKNVKLDANDKFIFYVLQNPNRAFSTRMYLSIPLSQSEELLGRAIERPKD